MVCRRAWKFSRCYNVFSFESFVNEKASARVIGRVEYDAKLISNHASNDPRSKVKIPKPFQLLRQRPCMDLLPSLHINFNSKDKNII